jgi:cyclophilin family peptidyl-prolyl cis-trans isomerase/protein-disulfide isomerase
MKKGLFLVPLLLLVVSAGCDSGAAMSTPTRTSTLTPTPAGPASCYLAPLQFAEVPVPPVTEADQASGPADADIVVIEYADFQCSACAGRASLHDRLEDAPGDNVIFIFRHFTLDYHPLAVTTAEAAEAAGAQGAFWEMHDLLYARQGEWSASDQDSVIPLLAAYAEELGLDVERFSDDLQNHVYLDKVTADSEGARDLGLPYTPSYIVNGVFYPSSDLGVDALLLVRFTALMETEQYSALPPRVIGEGKEYAATIATSKGAIVVELFSEEAPTNTNSFAFLAGEGWYDGLEFFAVEYELAAQAGDPASVGWGLPFAGYYCGDETRPELSFNEAGMLALYSPQQGVNVSQFFITYVPLPELNGRYTIIGRVTEGMDILQSLTQTVPGFGQPEPDVIESITVDEQ